MNHHRQYHVVALVTIRMWTPVCTAYK